MSSLVVIIATLTIVNGDRDPRFGIVETKTRCDTKTFSGDPWKSVRKQRGLTLLGCAKQCEAEYGLFIYGRPETYHDGECKCEGEAKPGEKTCTINHNTTTSNNYDLYYIETCKDKVKNGKEEGIDCGGECKRCGYVFIEENKECDSTKYDKSSWEMTMSTEENTPYHCREKCKYYAGMFIYGRVGTDGEGRCQCEQEVGLGTNICQTSGTENYDLYAITEIDCQTKVYTDCVFPFKYKGKTYTECTGVNHQDNVWCSTKVDSNDNYMAGQWKNCREGDICKPCTIPNGKLVWFGAHRNTKRRFYKVECNAGFKRNTYDPIAFCSMGKLIPSMTCEEEPVLKDQCVDYDQECASKIAEFATTMEEYSVEKNQNGCDYYLFQPYIKEKCIETCQLNKCKGYGGTCKIIFSYFGRELGCICRAGFSGTDCESYRAYSLVNEQKQCSSGTERVSKGAKASVGECAAACHNKAGMFTYQRSGNDKECRCETGVKDFSCSNTDAADFDLYKIDGYYLERNNHECNSEKYEFDGNDRSSIEKTLTDAEKTPGHCAQKCKDIAGMFIYGRDRTSGAGRCQCEREARPGDFTCYRSYTNNYDLYTIIDHYFVGEKQECDSSRYSGTTRSSLEKTLSENEKKTGHCAQKCKDIAGMFIYGREGTPGAGRCQCEREARPGDSTCHTTGTQNFDLYMII